MTTAATRARSRSASTRSPRSRSAPNATRVYTGATNSLDPQSTMPGDVATFARNPATGALSWLGCQTRRAAITDVRPLPHSSAVLVSTLYGDRGLGVAGGSLDLYRPKPGGVLTRVRQLACVAHAPCPIPYYSDPARLAVTPDGATVYVGMIFAGLTVLRHGAHGVQRSARPGRMHRFRHPLHASARVRARGG